MKCQHLSKMVQASLKLKKYNYSASSLCRILKTNEAEFEKSKELKTKQSRSRSVVINKDLEEFLKDFIFKCNSMSFLVSCKLIKNTALKYAEKKV